MPVRASLVTDHASRILLEGIVDYAGLFPPAAMAMPGAVRNYAHYRAGGSGWMLGRFVCPANTLELFSKLADALLPRDAGAIPWRLSATGSGDIAADVDAIAAFNERHRVCFEECGAYVDSYELRVNSETELAAVDAAVPRDVNTYCELPPALLEDLFPALAASGRRAKIRTGGVTLDAFPSADSVVNFLTLCIENEVTAKATAGLHHPLRGDYRLTYEADSISGRMFGFLNVFLCAALLLQGGGHAAAVRLLEESDPSAITVDEYQVTWRNARGTAALGRVLLQRVREQLLVSFGSCSFTEPVDESRALGWLPSMAHS